MREVLQMKDKTIWLFLLVLALSSLESASCRSFGATSQTTITASVASSLQTAMEEIVPAFEQAHHDVRVIFNFGSSGMLAQQIEHGAPANVFFSAAGKPMDLLESEGILQPGTRHDLLRNRIVLIAPKNHSRSLNFAALANAQVKLIALGDPGSVPAGDYGKQVLTTLGLWKSVQPKLVLAKDVRQVLTYVETGDADAGIVYATDAKNSTKVDVVETAAENTHAPVVYPVAVVKQSAKQSTGQSAESSEAKKFVEFLAAATARDIFIRYGFTMVGP